MYPLIVVGVAPLLLFLYPCSPHIVIIVPHKSPYCYYCALTLLLLGRLGLHCGPTRITLWPHGLLYIERRFCNLNHPRIVHSCNVLEVAPSNCLISKVLISLFFSFWRWFHNIWYQRILGFSLLQTGHRGIFAITLFLQIFRS